MSGPLEVAVFNIGANVQFPAARDHRAGLFQGLGDGRVRGLPGRPRGGPTHGAPRPRHDPLYRRHRQPARPHGLLRLAGAKHALRALAQSLSRELGPQGIHVAHRGRRRHRHSLDPREFSGPLRRSRTRTASSIRSTLPRITGSCIGQPRDAWTHELDLRPWSEKLVNWSRMPYSPSPALREKVASAASRMRGRARTRRWR